MFCATKKLFLNAVTIFTLCGLVLKTDALFCREGNENSAGFIFWRKKCTESQPACFGSVKCFTIGETNYQNYEWNCIDKGQCSNGTGKSFAHYKGIKGMIQSVVVQSLCFALHGQTECFKGSQNAPEAPYHMGPTLACYVVMQFCR